MSTTKSSAPLVSILMGSDSDWPTMKAAAEVLTEFGIASEVKVISAHRTPRDLEQDVSSSPQLGVGGPCEVTVGAAMDLAARGRQG